MKEAPKKIKIRKNPKLSSSSSSVNHGGKLSRNLDLLDKTVKKIENKYKNFGFYDSKEEDFFETNQDKMIIMELNNQNKVEGKLKGIDKFRICIEADGIAKYFFKHAVLCYYAQG